MTDDQAGDRTGCPAGVTPDLLAGRWRPMISYWLLRGPMRCNGLQRRLGRSRTYLIVRYRGTWG